MKKILITLLKIAGSLGILVYLFWDATHKDVAGQNIFMSMLQQPKRWDLLAAAVMINVVAILITLIRWWYLVRAVGIDFSLKDALRRTLGYLFNLAPMGIVGGDLLKAVLLSREKPGNKAKAAASVVVRPGTVGLYVLFLVATAGVF